MGCLAARMAVTGTNPIAAVAPIMRRRNLTRFRRLFFLGEFHGRRKYHHLESNQLADSSFDGSYCVLCFWVRRQVVQESAGVISHHEN